MQKGTLYWFTGLSGAGKTTIAKLFYDRLRNKKPNVVFLDGDVLREVFGNVAGHTAEERKKIAKCYSRLCNILAEQGIDVVCATISMFHDCRRWNRDNILNYKEIYLKVPMEVLIERDSKSLYKRALKGEIQNVMGINIPVEEPEEPDVILENDGRHNPIQMVDLLLNQLKME